MITFFDEILNYVGLDRSDFAITNEFYANVKGPRNRKIEVKVFGIANIASTFENPIDPMFFVVLNDSYKWAEITEAEYKALEILKDFGWNEHILHAEYDLKRQEAVVIGKDSKTTMDDVATNDEFLQIVDAMCDVRSIDFYKRFKEAKHE